MALPTERLMRALEDTAHRLESTDARYRWTHQGACNCGHLAQTLTGRSGAEIHRVALERPGDWSEHAVDYCPDSGYRIDDLIGELLDSGLSLPDLGNLERLGDPRVLARVAEDTGRTGLDHRRREDVVVYLRAFAALLRERAGLTESGTFALERVSRVASG